MASVLITGCNRGIGLGLVREYLKKADVQHLIATCRDPKHADELHTIQDQRLSIVKMDVTCNKTIKKAVEEVSKIVSNSGLNILINNAGVLERTETDSSPERKEITEHLITNAVSPAVVIQYFLPLVKLAMSATGVCKIVNISSNHGSITRDIPEKGSGSKGYLGYNMSKAALNAMTKTMATDLDDTGIIVVAYHPGHVRTEMGGPDAPTTVEESAFSLVSQIDQLTKEKSGGYFDRTGETLPP